MSSGSTGKLVVVVVVHDVHDDDHWGASASYIDDIERASEQKGGGCAWHAACPVVPYAV